MMTIGIMSNIAGKWKAFCEWQQRPALIIKKSAEQHCCATCGEVYQGNYCPQCGQSAQIGRYSFRKATLLFLDVWGVGNRGMFRTLRDLILRPGYLIRDYISGMQSAYFPPFKLVFLMTAFFMFVNFGITQEKQTEYDQGYQRASKEYKESIEKYEGKKNLTERERSDLAWSKVLYLLNESLYEKTAIVFLVIMFLLTIPLYVFFRKTPNIPDMRFSELLVAMVYIMSMLEIYAILYYQIPFIDDSFFYAWICLPIIPLKQLSGFKWWRTILYVLLAYLGLCLLIFAGIWGSAEILALTYQWSI